MQIQPRLVAVEQVGVEHGRAHVVGCGHRVHVAGEVEVEQLHGHHLAVAAAGRAPFDAERRPQGGLANGDSGPLVDVAEPLAQPHGCGGLALAQRGGSDGRHHYVAGPGPVGQRLDGVQADLGRSRPVGLQHLGWDAGFLGDLGQRSEIRPAGDLKIGWKRHGPASHACRLFSTPPAYAQSSGFVRRTLESGGISLVVTEPRNDRLL